MGLAARAAPPAGELRRAYRDRDGGAAAGHRQGPGCAAAGAGRPGQPDTLRGRRPADQERGDALGLRHDRRARWSSTGPATGWSATRRWSTRARPSAWRCSTRRRRQQQSQAAGLRRLVLLNTPDPTRWVVGHLSNADKLALGHSPYATVPDLLADARLASVGELIRRQQTGPVLRRRRVHRALRRRARRQRRVHALGRQPDRGDPHRARLPCWRSCPGSARSASRRPPTSPSNSATWSSPASCPRPPTSTWSTCRATCRPPAARISTLLDQPARDRAGLEIILRCEDAYAELCARGAAGPAARFVDDVGWLLEELRVSLFAQPLRTKVPVSEKRVLNAIAQARARLS